VIPCRTSEQLAVMRRAGRVVAEMHEIVRAALRPGLATVEIDRLCRKVLERRGAVSNFLGYHGFPATVCVSINEEIVHGIPSSRRLEPGDLVSVDCGAIVDGWHADAAFSTVIETAAPMALELIDAAEAALAAGIDEIRDGHRLGDVGAAISAVVDSRGLAIVDGYGGHGIGRAMHEAPDVLNWGRRGRGQRLRVGNTLCLEPMVCGGSGETELLEDGWTVVTDDGSWAAHAEHTVLVGPDGPEVLTMS